MKYKKLSELANVQSGLVLSRKQAKEDSLSVFKYKQLNLRSLNNDGSISIDTLDEYLSNEKLDEQFITEENDVLMRLFAPLYPAIIREHYIGLVIPSQLSIIRMKTNVILPAFLYCYLSQPSVINAIVNKAGGYAVRGIKVSTLSDIEIPILPINKQKAITTFYETHHKRKSLYMELIEQYDLQASAIISKAIEGGEK
jgi:restriction endonuclease S subunit